jgi:ADP-ribose pyrophosphatase YjhB (NUDIX family)
MNPENRIFLQYMNGPVRQPRPTQKIRMSELLTLTEEDEKTPPPNNDPKPKKDDKENEATKQAHSLGLESDGYGYWKDKTGKRVARTLKGKLVKLTSDDPYEHDKPKQQKRQQMDLGLGMPDAKSKYDKHDKETGGYWKKFFHGDQSYWSGGKQGKQGGKDTGRSEKQQQGPSLPQYFKTSEPVYSSGNETKWTIDNPPDIPELNGVPFDFWMDAPTDLQGWQNVEGKNPNIKEPKELTSKWKNEKFGAGIIIIEPDNKVWVVEPMGHYGGYKYTFPKGTQDPGLDLQSTAIKEAYEESGLKVQLTDWVGDVTRTTSTARYYLGKRVGGSPIGHGIETQGVSLVPIEEIGDFVNMGVDKKIARMLMKKLGIIKPLNLPKASDIMAKKIGGQKVPKKVDSIWERMENNVT